MWLVAILQKEEHSWIQTHTPADVAQHSQPKNRHKNHEQRKKELHLATAFGFTTSKFHVGLSGCQWFIPFPAFKEQHFQEQPRSTASGATPLQAWGEMAGVQEEWGNQSYNTEVIRQPQITTQGGMSGPEHTRGFVWVCFVFFIVVVLDFLWVSTKLPSFWNQAEQSRDMMKAGSQGWQCFFLMF